MSTGVQTRVIGSTLGARRDTPRSPLLRGVGVSNKCAYRRPNSNRLKGAITMKRKRPSAAIILLATAAVTLSACDNEAHATLPYINGAKVDCGGKQTLVASGSTAQAHAMTQFIGAYHQACTAQTLKYDAIGSGAGITEFLSGKTDFAGSD